MSLSQIGKKTREASQHYDNRVFTFENRNSKETFVGTGYNFRIKYNITSQAVGSLKTGRAKSYHGWIITKRP